jgi:uncharacterized SAM-dependent methyltransferase
LELALNTMTPIWVHSSVRAAPQKARRRDSLLSGAIDHLFHYQGVRQSQLWLEVHRKHAPLFAEHSFEDIFRKIAALTARRLKNQPVHVIALGPGGGEKEAWLLEALRDSGCKLRYTPVDAGIELALLSAGAAAPFLETEPLPIVGDLSLLPELPAWLGRYPENELRLYTAFGLTPNFLPSWLFSRLSSLMRPQDQLLLSANLAPVAQAREAGPEAYPTACESILPQYNNPETLRWLTQVLSDWGIERFLSTPHFSLQHFENILGFSLQCEWLEETRLEWEDAPFRARAGEKLRLFFSLRYTPERLADTLHAFGLHTLEGFITPCRQEGVWHATLR